MSLKILTCLAFAVFLTGCGGENDHPEELLGSWSIGCEAHAVGTITFDSAITLTYEDHSDSSCTEKNVTLSFGLNALYEPDLQTTSSGIEALRASLTLASMSVTPYSDFFLEYYKGICPQQSWNRGETTNVMACEHSSMTLFIASYEPDSKALFFLDGNNLYANLSRDADEPRNTDGFPLDVNYEEVYIKQ